MPWCIDCIPLDENFFLSVTARSPSYIGGDLSSLLNSREFCPYDEILCATFIGSCFTDVLPSRMLRLLIDAVLPALIKRAAAADAA